MLKRIFAALLLLALSLTAVSCSADENGEPILVEKVEITNLGLKHNETWGKYVVIYPNEDGELKYRIAYKLSPDNASNKEVNFSYDKQNPDAEVDSSGLVTLKKAGIVKVIVNATDGGGAKDSITVIAVK